MPCICRYTAQRGVTDCDARTCDYVLTYRVSEGDLAHFEMSATAGWVAVGFSSDEFMVVSLFLHLTPFTFVRLTGDGDGIGLDRRTMTPSDRETRFQRG